MVSEVVREGMGVAVASAAARQALVELTQKQWLKKGRGIPWREHRSEFPASQKDKK